MLFLVSLLVALVIALALKVPIQKLPWIFYILAVGLISYYVYAYFNGADPVVWRYLLVVLQRCTLSLAFLTIVMFIGVLPEGSAVRNYLAPIRRQLSIIGCLLAAGHIIVYISAYIARITAGFTAMDANMIAALLLAGFLVLLLIILLVTSFTQIHKRMRPEIWKNIQRLSYPFYLLIYVHIILIMLPSIMAGAGEIVTNIIIYTIIFALYSVLRLLRYFMGKNKSSAYVQEENVEDVRKLRLR